MAEDKMKHNFKVLIIGGSAGSLDVLLKVLPGLRKTVTATIVLVLHRKSSSESTLVEILSRRTVLPVKEVEDKQPLLVGHIYIAPADYHLLFEENEVMALDYSERVNYSRPSIDVAFESASEVFGPSLTCLLLSGANADGMAGLKLVKQRGGHVAVQDPATADSPFMPQQAIRHISVDQVLKIEEMALFINSL